MKVQIHLAGRQYESVWFEVEGASGAEIKTEWDKVAAEVQAVTWDAYEALVALRDGRSVPDVAAPQAALPTADELIKSELGGKVLDVVDSTASDAVPFWGRKSEPQAAASAAEPAAPAAFPSFF